MKIIVKYILFALFILNVNAKDNIDFTTEEKIYLNKKEVKVAILPDFPPFSFYKDEKLTGYSYDILELISKKSGLKIKYEIDSWPKNLQKFKEKKVDIIDAISFKENRLNFTEYTKPYYEIPLVIFSRKDLTNYTGLESLKGKTLGNTKNIFYKKQIEDLNIFKIKEYDSFKEKLRALAFGEVDIIFAHLLSTQIAISKSKYTNMKVLDDLNLPNLKKTDLRFGITKGNETLHAIINKTFSSITKEEWDYLYNKWISLYTANREKKVDPLLDLSQEQRDFLIKNNFDCVVPPSWGPFEFIENGKISGISYDFWNLIKEKALINSKCRVVESFDKVLELIKNKKADISVATAITENKLKYGRFSIPYSTYPIAIATTSDKQYFTDTSSLNGKKVAVGKSYSSYYILKDKYPEIDFIEYENNIEGLKALSIGEVYAVIDILPVLSHQISRYGFNNLKISGTTEFDFDVRIMVRDDYKELIPIINQGILSISNNEKQDIKNKWLSVKVETLVNYGKLWEIGLVILIVLIILFYRQYILNKHNKKLQEVNTEIKIKTSELQRKTRQLARQKELFEKIYNESSDGIILSRFQSDSISDCNKVAYKLLGYDNKEEFMLLSPEDTLPLTQPDGTNSLDILYKKRQLVYSEKSAQFELVYKKKDNSNIWLEVVITAINLAEEEFLHIVWRDIDTRKYMEEKLNVLTHNLEEKVKQEVYKNEEKTKQLIQQSRLAQMGEMISMIAHQWRQPLTAISATANNLLIRMLINEKLEKEDLQNEINLISDYSQHLSMTIDDFRNFFKTDKEKIDKTLESIVDNSISIMKSSLESRNISLETDYQCNKELNIYATEVNQVILNIIKNAEDAFIENHIINASILVKTYIEENSAIIEIIDNANGIPEKILNKIFDPYFSTKKNKDGTGLGLYMSRIIINEHCNGELSVENNSNGAIFKLKLPL